MMRIFVFHIIAILVLYNFTMFYNSILYYCSFIFVFGILFVAWDLTPYDKYLNKNTQTEALQFGARDTLQLLSFRTQIVCSNTNFGGAVLHIKNVRYTHKIFPG